MDAFCDIWLSIGPESKSYETTPKPYGEKIERERRRSDSCALRGAARTVQSWQKVGKDMYSLFCKVSRAIPTCTVKPLRPWASQLMLTHTQHGVVVLLVSSFIQLGEKRLWKKDRSADPCFRARLRSQNVCDHIASTSLSRLCFACGLIPSCQVARRIVSHCGVSPPADEKARALEKFNARKIHCYPRDTENREGSRPKLAPQIRFLRPKNGPNSGSRKRTQF